MLRYLSMRRCSSWQSHSSDPLCQARIEEVAQDLEPLQMTTILWSFGKLNYHPGIELMEALLSAVTLNTSSFATQVSHAAHETA